jgi:hypothetical protein
VVVGSVPEACALTSGAGSALETMLTPQGDHRLRGSVTDQGHKVSHTTVAQWLADLDYSLQGTRKP